MVILHCVAFECVCTNKCWYETNLTSHEQYIIFNFLSINLPINNEPTADVDAIPFMIQSDLA